MLTLMLGTVVLRIALTGEYLRYVKPGLRPYLLIAAAGLLLLGLVTLVRAFLGRARGGSHGPGVGWLLLAPVLAFVLVSPPALGAQAARTARPPHLATSGGGFPALAGRDPVPLTFPNYLRRALASPSGHGSGLVGRTVRLEGFVTPRPGGGYYLTRMIISCCAADATAVKIMVLGTAGGHWAADTWLSVTGRYQPGHDGDPANQIPLLEARTVRRIAAPRDPYQHP
jgi:uncharacterized repeat protein (TIGR03943 family)